MVLLLCIINIITLVYFNNNKALVNSSYLTSGVLLLFFPDWRMCWCLAHFATELQSLTADGDFLKYSLMSSLPTDIFPISIIAPSRRLIFS